MPSFHLTAEQRHLVWDNSLDPVAQVGPGDELVLELADASGARRTGCTPGDPLRFRPFEIFEPEGASVTRAIGRVRQ